MTISIKPTASGSTIEQDGSTILTVDGSGNITPSNSMYPKVSAFSAYQSSAQTLSAGVWTKVQFQTKEFDTNSNFDNTTNYRFTPTVAGYYQINAQAQVVNGSTTEFALSVYKNGSNFKYLNDIITPANRNVGGSTLVYFNGSTDYAEIYAYISITGNTANSYVATYFQAHLVSV